MKMMIKCKSPDMACCPRCAGKLNLSRDMRTGYCGHCGSVTDVEITEQVDIIPEETEENFTQISLFDM